MLKLPKRIRIGSTYYKIVRRKLNNDKWGECDVNNAVISLAIRFPNQSMKAKTLYHEIIHAIRHEYGVEMPYDLEEKFVEAMESGIAALAHDHQKLFIDIVKAMGGK